MQELMLKPRILTKADLNRVYRFRDAFVQEYRGFKLYEYQKKPSNEIIESVFNNEGNTVMIEYSRQSGKTELVALTVCFLLLYYREIMLRYRNMKVREFNAGVFAPLQEQAKTAFDKMKSVLNTDRVKRAFDVIFQEANGNTLRLMNGTIAYCFSASPTSHTESKTMHLIIMDEAQLMDDGKINNTILPMGTNTNATIIYIGTAGYRKCKFYDMLHSGMRFENRKVFVYDFKKIVREKIKRYFQTQNPVELNYYNYLKTELGAVGVKIENPKQLMDLNLRDVMSDAFMTQYALQWMLERGQFITFEKLKLVEGDYDIIEEDKKNRYYAGVDFGKMHDSTVVTIGDDKGRIVRWIELFGENYEDQFHMILNYFKSYNIVSVCCDSSANQDQMVDRFRRVLEPAGVRVTGVNFSTTKSDMYKNLYFFLNPVYEGGERVSDSRLQYPKTECIEKEKFIQQMVDLTKEIDDKGKWKCAHPEGDAYHDDYPDSVALYAWNFTFYSPLLSNIRQPPSRSIAEIQKDMKELQKNQTWDDRLKQLRKIGTSEVRSN